MRLERGEQPLEERLISSNPTGDAELIGLLLPSSVASAPRYEGFRRLASESWSPLLVVTASGVAHGVHHLFELAFILLGRGDGLAEPLRMFRVPRHLDEGVSSDFANLLKRKGGRGTHGFVLTGIPAPGESLDFDLNDPTIKARADDLANFGSAKPMGELFELLKANPAHPLGDVNHEVSGLIRLVQGRDIRRDGTIAPEELNSPSSPYARSLLLQEGDWVIRAIRSRSDPGGLVAAEVTREQMLAGFGLHVIVARPRTRLTEAQRIVLRLFFRSKLCGLLVNRVTTSTIALNSESLAGLPIPQPDEQMSSALVDLTAVAAHMSKWNSDAEVLLQSMFDDESAAQARARIIKDGRDLRMRTDAASMLDDYAFTIRTRFPYPIAFRWRSLEAHVSGNDLERAHKAILDCFEILMCFVANVAIVSAKDAGLELRATEGIRTKINAGRGGTTLGGWTQILQEAAESRSFRRAGEGLPLGEIRAVLDPASDAPQACRRLAVKRNADAHLRRLTAPRLSEAVEESLADLMILMRQSAFLTDLELVHVTSNTWDTITKRALVKYRSLMGDHPIVPFRTEEIDRNDLEAGSLYVRDTAGSLHLLRPFLIGRECPDCQTWSTFCLDQDTGGHLTIKSLEQGHVLEDDALRPALEHVGLL